MSKHSIIPYAFAALLAAITACNTSGDKEYPPAEIAEVHSTLRDFSSSDSITRNAIIQAQHIELAAFLKAVGDGEPTVETVGTRAMSPASTVFIPLVDSVFPDISPLRQTLGDILGRAADIGLSIPKRRYATVVYGRPQSILFVDSTMLIALNHYLGEEFPGYSHLPAYIRATKNASMLPADIAEALVATAYPYNAPAGTSAIARLIYEGALAHTKMALTCTAAAPETALGYDISQYQWLEQNETSLWRTLVEKQLLYDTSEGTTDRLVAPSPATSILGHGTPGRAGRFIGWKIVESYLRRNPATPADSLLSPAFYTSPSALRQSGYNPRP